LRGLKGTRSLADLEPGSYRVELEDVRVLRKADGRKLRPYIDRLRCEPDRIVLPIDPATPARLRIQRRVGTSSIGVTVSVDDGTPVEGAVVQISQRSDSGKVHDRIATTRCDAKGRAKFSRLPAGRYTVRLVNGGAFASTIRQKIDFSRPIEREIDLADDEQQAITLSVAPGGALVGLIEPIPKKGETGPIVSLRRLWPDGVWRPPGKQRGALRGREFRADGVLPGRYRIIGRMEGRPIEVVNTQVKFGQTTRFDMKFGPPTQRTVTLRLDHSGKKMLKTHERAQLSRVSVQAGRDLAKALVKWNEPTDMRRTSSLRSGTYVLLLWGSRLARELTLTDEVKQTFRFEVPRPIAGTGTNKLRVRVHNPKGKPMSRLLVTIRLRGDTSGWMRFSETWTEDAWFDDVGEGEFDVFVYDGVFGVTHNTKEPRTAQRVRIHAGLNEVTVRPKLVSQQDDLDDKR